MLMRRLYVSIIRGGGTKDTNKTVTLNFKLEIGRFAHISIEVLKLLSQGPLRKKIEGIIS